MCVTVKACKQDLDGNSISCQSDNHILDMQLYDREFPNEEVTPLIANAIAQAMYAQCDVDGNEYLLFKCFVDIQSDHTAISLDEQRSSIIAKIICTVLPLVGMLFSVEGLFHIMGKVIRLEGISPLTDG